MPVKNLSNRINQHSDADKETPRTDMPKQAKEALPLVKAKKIQQTAHHGTMALLPEELKKMRKQLCQVLTASSKRLSDNTKKQDNNRLFNAHINKIENANQNRQSSRLLTPMTPLSDVNPVKIRVDWRWMLGTILMGCASIAMIGEIFYSTLNNKNITIKHLTATQQANLKSATNPVNLKSATSPVNLKIANQKYKGNNLTILGQIDRHVVKLSNDSMLTESLKADLIKSTHDNVISKRIVQNGILTLIDGKEFIEVKPHVSLSAGLIIDRHVKNDNIPPFDPFIFLGSKKNKNLQDRQKRKFLNNDNVTVSLTDLPLKREAFQDINEQINSPDVLSKLKMMWIMPTLQHANQQQITKSDYAFRNIFSEAFPSYNSNITALKKTRIGPADLTYLAKENTKLQKIDTITSDNSLVTLLMKNDVTLQDAQAIIAAMLPVFPPHKIKKGNTIRIAFATKNGNNHKYPVRVSAFQNKTHLVTVGLMYETGPGPDGARFTALEDMAALTDSFEQKVSDSKSKTRVSLYRSLFETGRKNNIPDSIITQMVRIHAYNTDFEHTTQLGDSFSLLYIADDSEGNVHGVPQILYSSLTVDKEIKKFYRFHSPNNGKIDYYDENGESAQAFLIRKPVESVRISSSFGLRRHPITHKKKLHTGVDWVAASGTPIMASGDGIIEKAKRLPGYGKYTVIRHANNYKSAYAHQSKFAKGLIKGKRVKQGEIIGYVGSTGLSTGPHLHYELMVDGKLINPLRLQMPRKHILRGTSLAKFQQEKYRIDNIVGEASYPIRVAKTRTKMITSSE